MYWSSHTTFKCFFYKWMKAAAEKSLVQPCSIDLQGREHAWDFLIIQVLYQMSVDSISRKRLSEALYMLPDIVKLITCYRRNISSFDLTFLESNCHVYIYANP